MERRKGDGREPPTESEVLGYLADRNWGRWGDDDQVGAMNLVTPQKIVAAARLVRTGRAVSLSRDFPVTPSPGNPRPAQHDLRVEGDLEADGYATDYYGIDYHGLASTHIDALCHIWQGGLLWNGKKAAASIRSTGATFGGIESWRQGITTRGVMFDVPRYRGEPYVTREKPVHGWELEAIAEFEGVAVEPGDALVVHCGRGPWERDNNELGTERNKPGLHMSCLKFLRRTDCSLLVWDMLDSQPNGYGHRWAVHAALTAYGIGLVDNAVLGPLARICEELGRYEFLLTVAPLPVVGGTGSPVNPIALF